MPRSVPVPRSGGTRKSDLGERIEVSKTSVYQRAHSYHTKVPPDAIVPFFKAFTRPGDTVYDPFCGSGMTGIAALLADRNALLSDVSIAAVHIARNYTRPCDPSAFSKALKVVERNMEPIVSGPTSPCALRHSSNTQHGATFTDARLVVVKLSIGKACSEMVL